MPGNPFDTDRLDAACALAARQVEDGSAPFVILGVATRAGIVRLEAMSPPDRPRIGTEAVCPIASITKPIVATTVMQHVAEGSLALGAPLEAVLPELGGADREQVTAWHLLGHTSGLADLDFEELSDKGQGSAEVLERALRLESIAPLGAAYQYTTATYDLLAEVVARLDGVPFETALRRRVLDPLGMAATTFDPRTSLAARMVPVELADPAGAPRSPERARPAQMDTFIPLRLAGGGLWSSPNDLLRFGRAMLRGGELDGHRVLPRAQLELMTREVTAGPIGAATDPLAANHYSLGWGRPGPDTPGSRHAFGHGGATGTRLWIDPDHDLVFLYLTGVWGYPLAPIDQVMQAVYAAVL